MNPPKVSVIVPVYNVPKFIERCARSLFAQTFAEMEFIFVDDCTPDNSISLLQNVLKEFPQRVAQVQILHHATNRGLAAARNTGLAVAQGDFVQHIDSDDFLEPEMIATMYAKAMDENADMVVSDFIFDWDGRTKICHQSFSADAVTFTNLLLNGTILPGVVNKLIRRSLYTENNITSIEGLNVGEDYVTTPRLAYFAKKIAKVEPAFYHYVQTNQSAYTKKCGQATIDNLVKALQILSDFFQSKNDYDLYKESLLQGKLKKKMTLLANAEKQFRSQILSLFPETDTAQNKNVLTNHEKMIFWLSKHRLFRLLAIYLCLYNFLFELLQSLKGRR